MRELGCVCTGWCDFFLELFARRDLILLSGAGFSSGLACFACRT